MKHMMEKRQRLNGPSGKMVIGKKHGMTPEMEKMRNQTMMDDCGLGGMNKPHKREGRG